MSFLSGIVRYGPSALNTERRTKWLIKGVIGGGVVASGNISSIFMNNDDSDYNDGGDDTYPIVEDFDMMGIGSMKTSRHNKIIRRKKQMLDNKMKRYYRSRKRQQQIDEEINKLPEIFKSKYKYTLGNKRQNDESNCL